MKRRKPNVVPYQESLSETKMADLMLKQVMSWPSRVHPDEVAATLLVGAWLIMAEAYGYDNADERLAIAGAVAGARLRGGGGGPTHRMNVAA